MKDQTLQHPLLNDGKKTKIYYPVSDDEFKNQIQEIYINENYGFYLPEDGVYFDLGANVGMASLYFANWAKKIYAVEPNPTIYKALVKNTKHLGNKIETFNVAIANGTGKEMMYGADDDLPQTFWNHSNSSTGTMVDCMSSIDFFNKHNIPHIDLMKVDIEESEYVIFPDPKFGEVTKNIDAIVGEAHSARNGGFPEIIPELLKEWGYETTWPKLKTKNYLRFFDYTDISTGQKKRYEYEMSTIFLAKKND